MKKIILAKPRGFCAGVRRAIQTVEKALEKYKAPVYLNHPIVHNEYVVGDIKQKGAIFVDSIQTIPEESVVIFSAHGVAPQVREEAQERGLKIIDATCPLVTKVHKEVCNFFKQGYTIIFIGHKNHPEVIGVMGEAPMILVESEDDIEKLDIKNTEKIACLTQTTLCFNEVQKIIQKLKIKFPNLVLPPGGSICYATQNRQKAVREMAKISDLVLVVGSKQSSNSNRLVDVAKEYGTQSYLIQDVSDFKAMQEKNNILDVQTISITSGASTPENLVQDVIDYLKDLFPDLIIKERSIIDEKVAFPLPLD